MTDLRADVLAALDVVMADAPQPEYRKLNGLSMSHLGGCRRQGAYYLWHTVQKTDENGSRAALVGTALHAVWLPKLAQLLAGNHEQEVWFEFPNGVQIPGTVDLLLADAVIDLKTVGPRGFDLITQPRRTWIMQVTAGALAFDRPLCGVIVVCRDTGRVKWFGWETVEHEAELIAWLDDAKHLPAEVTRDYRGPGIDKECDWCPFNWTCWPEQANGAAPQAVMVHDDPGTALMLDQYVDAADREKQAKQDKEYARACLTGSANGIYGSHVLVWRQYGAAERLDDKAARQLLETVGLPIPIKLGEPRTVIDVRPAPDGPD